VRPLQHSGCAGRLQHFHPGRAAGEVMVSSLYLATARQTECCSSCAAHACKTCVLATSMSCTLRKCTAFSAHTREACAHECKHTGNLPVYMHQWLTGLCCMFDGVVQYACKISGSELSAHRCTFTPPPTTSSNAQPPSLGTVTAWLSLVFGVVRWLPSVTASHRRSCEPLARSSLRRACCCCQLQDPASAPTPPSS
jgi:hypothetical protein